MNQNQVAHFQFLYPKTGQAPDALLARGTKDAMDMFLEPDKFTFYAVYDTYPDEDPDEPSDPSKVRIAVMAQLSAPKPWYKNNPFKRKTRPFADLHY